MHPSNRRVTSQRRNDRRAHLLLTVICRTLGGVGGHTQIRMEAFSVVTHVSEMAATAARCCTATDTFYTPFNNTTGFHWLWYLHTHTESVLLTFLNCFSKMCTWRWRLVIGRSNLKHKIINANALVQSLQRYFILRHTNSYMHFKKFQTNNHAQQKSHRSTTWFFITFSALSQFSSCHAHRSR